MEAPDYKALAGPLYFLLIGCEVWLTRRMGKNYYRLNDAINDVSTGLLMQLCMLLSRGVVVAGYIAIYANLRVTDLSAASEVTWLGCFIAVDLGYYWFHRLSHEINFLWAAHVVHHQSEDYNLAVALRQSTLQPFFGSFFYWPLALFGFPPAVFLACSAFNTIYQFWLHTQTIRTLGPLEAVLVTPSHHRVHHGRNPIYIDRNHGGTFIVWDKLFGTFQRETEKVAYGITKPLASWNPVWANVHYWAELVEVARRTRAPLDKLRVFLKPPGWFPEDQGGTQPPPPVGDDPSKFDRPYPQALFGYALYQFALLVVATVVLVYFEGSYSSQTALAGAVLIVWGLLGLGGLFDGRRWAHRSEALRAFVAMCAPLLLAGGAEAWLATAAFGVGLLFWELRLARLPDWVADVG